MDSSSIKVKPAWRKDQRPQKGDMVRLGRTGRALKINTDNNDDTLTIGYAVVNVGGDKS